jgi:hypothetical protein
MLIKFPRGSGGLVIGRGFMRDRDVEVALSFGPRENPPEGEYRFYDNWHIDWDWPFGHRSRMRLSRKWVNFRHILRDRLQLTPGRF